MNIPGMEKFIWKRKIKELEARIKELEDFVRECADDYDHEEQTREHNPKYGGICRCCAAEMLLKSGV